jgi:hypothetical protein
MRLDLEDWAGFNPHAGRCDELMMHYVCICAFFIKLGDALCCLGYFDDTICFLNNNFTDALCCLVKLDDICCGILVISIMHGPYISNYNDKWIFYILNTTSLGRRTCQTIRGLRGDLVAEIFVRLPPNPCCVLTI